MTKSTPERASVVESSSIPEGWDAEAVLRVSNPEKNDDWTCPAATARKTRCRNVVGASRYKDARRMLNALSLGTAAKAWQNDKALDDLAKKILCHCHQDSHEDVKEQWKVWIQADMRETSRTRATLGVNVNVAPNVHPKPCPSRPQASLPAAACRQDRPACSDPENGVRLNDLVQQLQELRLRNRELEAEKQKALKERDMALGEGQSLKHALAQASSERHLLEEVSFGVDDEYNEMSDMLENYEEENGQLAEENGDLLKQNSRLLEENEKLRQKNANLVEANPRLWACRCLSAPEQTASQAQEEVRRLVRENKSLRRKNDGLLEENDRLNRQVVRLQSADSLLDEHSLEGNTSSGPASS